MMSLYLYGICKGNEEIPEKAGLADQPIFGVKYKNLSLVVSKVREKEIIICDSNYLTHARVIEELHSNFNILPIAFGNILANKDLARELLEKNYKKFVDKLDYLANRVEVSIKVLCREKHKKNREIKEVEDYLTELREKCYLDKRVDEIVEQIQEDLLEDILIQKLITKNLLLNITCLIASDQLEIFEEHYFNLKSDFSEFSFLYSGPWAPYSFVDLEVDLATKGGINDGKQIKSSRKRLS